MTLIASWLNLEPGAVPSVWAIADTKISDKEDGRVFTLTDEGAKLLELPIICKTLDNKQSVYYRSSIGFSYAGSSLIGLNSYATLNTLFSNLGSANLGMPDYLSIVEKAKVIIEKYSQSIQACVEVCIYGFCPKNKEPFLSSIKPELKEGLIHYNIAHKFGLVRDISCILLGDSIGQHKLIELINNRTFLFPINRGVQYWRAPVYGLMEIISNNDYETIGGDMQLTIASLGQFNHHWVLNNSGEIRNSFSFRNLDLLTEIGLQLGDCMISMSGMRFD